MSLVLQKIKESGGKLTPMMEQYYEIKKNYTETVVLFRMGDFYEVFFEDAELTSKVLNITLTQRGKINDIPIPMAGIPHHAASTYIDRLTQAGYKAAICEQLEDPKMAQGIVKRGVTQIVSPGIPFDIDKSPVNERNFLSAAYFQDGKFALTMIDFVHGDFWGVVYHTEEELIEAIRLYAPKEFVTFLGQLDNYPKIVDTLHFLQTLKTHLSIDLFSPKYSDQSISQIIPHYKKDAFLSKNPVVINAVAGLSYYLVSTQAPDSLTHIKPFQLKNNTKNLQISYSTLMGLEILPKNKDYQNSLVGFLDKTKTSMGSRLLKEFVVAPLMDMTEIENRYSLIEYFLKNKDLHLELRTLLDQARDIYRILAKHSTGKLTGDDTNNLKNTCTIFLSSFENTKKIRTQLPPLAPKLINDIKELVELIDQAISPDIAATIEKGNLIKAGFNKQRDKLANINDTVSEKIIALEAKYRQKFNIGNLKIKSNNISGFFIEVSASHTQKVPSQFKQKQTLTNNSRYTSEELVEIEKELLTAQDRLLKIDREIFESVKEKISANLQNLQSIAHWISFTDVMQSLAWVCLQEKFQRPNLVADKKFFEMENAWHPLIKSNLKNHFVPHSIKLDDKMFFGLITGPNMAGKTTVMREVALIQFLAQLGCFVPAEKATVGICDHIFSRLGASDDIINGQSTFMVEMSETSEILRHATDRSLILLDEIGRGTSTYDGLSIAWALVEYIAKELKAFTLFSTHYHELVSVVDDLAGAQNFTVKTVNEKGRIKFLYELIPQGATQSFGINVAQLAGLPNQIIKRSKNILNQLESAGPSHSHPGQMLMEFSPLMDEPSSPVLDEMKKINLNKMTPLQALNQLEQWQEALK